MKKIHRFLIQQDPKGTFTITEKETVHLIKNVLKLVPGETCIFFVSGGDDAICKIEKIESTGITATTEKTIPKKAVPSSVTAAVSITKRDTFEIIVQKLTELGVREIIPIISERTVKLSLNKERLQKISDEALEQCGLSERVLLRDPSSLVKTLEENKEVTQIYFDTSATMPYKGQGAKSIFYVGPEGGWSDKEIVLFKQYRIEPYSLSASILRSETAAIIAAHQLVWSSSF